MCLFFLMRSGLGSFYSVSWKGWSSDYDIELRKMAERGLHTIQAKEKQLSRNSEVSKLLEISISQREIRILRKLNLSSRP